MQRRVEEVKIPATGKHTAVTDNKESNMYNSRRKSTKCSVCDKVLSTEVQRRIKEEPATAYSKYSDYVIKKNSNGNRRWYS